MYQEAILSNNSWPFLEKISEQLNKFIAQPKKYLWFLAKLNKIRYKRKERLLVIHDVIMTMLPELNYSEFQIGYYSPNGKFIGKWDYEDLAKETGHHKTAIKRAFSDLKKAGYVMIDRAYTLTKKGKYMAHTGVKRFTDAFFNHLGISVSWRKQVQKWRRKKDKLPALVESKIQKCSGVKTMDQHFKNTYASNSKANSLPKIKIKDYQIEMYRKSEQLAGRPCSLSNEQIEEILIKNRQNK